LARLIKTTDALGCVTRQSWDAHGRLLSVTDALCHRHTYEYDKAGRLIKETRAPWAAPTPTPTTKPGGSLRE